MVHMTEFVERIIAADTMAEVYEVAGGPVVFGAWSRDVGTMERRLRLALVYPDGEISPVREYAKRKLTEAKALNDLADLDGIAPKMVNEIYEAVMKQHRNLPVQEDRNGQCSIMPCVSMYGSMRNLARCLSVTAMGISLPAISPMY